MAPYDELEKQYMAYLYGLILPNGRNFFLIVACVLINYLILSDSNQTLPGCFHIHTASSHKV